MVLQTSCGGPAIAHSAAPPSARPAQRWNHERAGQGSEPNNCTPQAERALAMKPDRDRAQELVDLLPQVDVDDTLLAEESFREMLAALDFRATFEPARNELRMRATLAPELP